MPRRVRVILAWTSCWSTEENRRFHAEDSISVNCAGQFPNRSVDDDDADLQKLLAHRGEETQTLHLSIPQNCSTVKILNRSDANLENRGKYCQLL